MAKKKLRKIHIDDREWKYYFKGQRGNCVIFSPDGHRYEIPIKQLLEFKGDLDPDFDYEYIKYSILPSDIKKFIEQLDMVVCGNRKLKPVFSMEEPLRLQ